MFIYRYHQLIYEGEFSNGKRNGYGREYDFDNGLIFEGKFLKGNHWNGRGIFSK